MKDIDAISLLDEVLTFTYEIDGKSINMYQIKELFEKYNWSIRDRDFVCASVINKLVEDGYMYERSFYYSLTLEGFLQVQTGGYKNKIDKENNEAKRIGRLERKNTIFSISALCVSAAVFLLEILKLVLTLLFHI